MTSVFLHFLNLSVTAGWMVLAVLLLRLCLKKAPRWITCVLWGLVALRLVVPFTIESPVSLIPTAEVVVSTEGTDTSAPVVNSGMTAIDKPLNDWLQTPVKPQAKPPVQSPLPPVTDTPTTPNPDLPAGDTTPTPQPPVEETPTTPEQPSASTEVKSVSRMERILSIAAPVWLVGIGLMLIYELFSVLRVRNRVLDAVLLRDNVWQSDRVDSPFILGVFRPRIYIPYGLEEPVLAQVLSHEQAHLHRRDHWIKPFAFTLLAVYWYNPLLWVGYILLCRDIEVACDERVVRGLDEDNRRRYATALLQCGVERRSIAACPLAFGEVSIKQRIKSVLNYRKPLLWVIISSLVVCSVAAVCLLTVPKSKDNGKKEEPSMVLSSHTITPNGHRLYYGTDTDGRFNEKGTVWMWDHAENPGDRKGETDIPLVITKTKAQYDELMGALDDPEQSGMHRWFDVDKYDETYFEDKAIVWLYVPGYDLGHYDYTVTLEETNKGLRYAVTLEYVNTSIFDPWPDNCEHLLLFETDRKGIEEAKTLTTRHERAPIIVPTEEENWTPHFIGNADLDGDGEEESIRVFRAWQSMNTAVMVVFEADGTPILRESIHPFDSSQCYLVPQTDGSSLLLFVGMDDNNGEEFGVLSLKDGERTVVEYRYDGKVSPNNLDLGDVISYVSSLSGWLEEAQLLFECENGSLYYGEELGDTPRYTPLCWLDEYRNSADDSLQETLENVITSLNGDLVSIGDIDFNHDGQLDSLFVFGYTHGSLDMYNACLLVKEADGTILTCFHIHTYYDTVDKTVYLYRVTDENGKEQLYEMTLFSNGTCFISNLTKNEEEDYPDMKMDEWLDYAEKTGAKLICYLQGMELHFSNENESDNFLKEDPTKYTVENYNESIVAYNSFLKGQRAAYEYGDLETRLYVSDLYVTLLPDGKGIRSYALADVTGDGVPELLTEGYTMSVFTYQSGRVLRLYESRAGAQRKLLSNGCLWEWRTGGGNTYWYTKFFEIGTTRNVQFGAPGYDTDEDKYHVDGVWMNKAEFDAKTATYFANAKSPALLIWYDYTTKQPTSQAMVQYLSLLQSKYSDDSGAYYTLYDVNGDGVEELLVKEDGDNKLLVYTKGNNEARLLVEQEFASGTSRFLSTGDPDYPGIIYFCVGGGKNQYYYLSKGFALQPLWTDNYGFYEEGEAGRITELSDDKRLIELSREAYQNNRDLAFSLFGGSVSTIALDRQYQQAVYTYSSDSKNHRDVGVLQPETQDIILIDGKYYQTCVASNVDVRNVWLSQNEADIGTAYWGWVAIGTEDDYSLSNIGKMDYMHHVPVALQPVVGNRQTFIYQGKSILLSDLLSQYDDEIGRYAVVDMDGDNGLELAVEFNSLQFILILKKEADAYYGYLFSFRNMYQINTDCSFYWNTSAGNFGCSRIQLSGGASEETELWHVERDGNDVSAYYVEGKKVTETQFESLTAETKNEVLWYEWP